MVRNSLNVYMNGLLVGCFTQKGNGENHFEYDQSWLNTNGARPISLSMPLRNKPYIGNVVYNFFDNLLPDSLDIRQRIVARHLAQSTQPFDLLSKIGQDMVGALQLMPTNSPPLNIQHITYKTLNNDELERILLGYQSNIPLGMLRELADFRISIAGAQEKTALLKLNNRWCLPQGTTPTTHIIKLPIGKITTHSYTLDLTQSVENEYLCLLIAKAYGLPVPSAEIIQLDKIKALAIERFDRRFSTNKQWIMRIPQEDFCQVLNISPGSKYENQGGPGIFEIMHFLEGSIFPKRDRSIFMQSQLLFWLLAATDGHAKNFSLFILPDGKFELTPLYDIISCYPMISKKGMNIQDAKLAMSLRGTKGKKYSIERIFPRHFLQTASYVGFSRDEMTAIMHQFAIKTPHVISHVLTQLPENFPKSISDAIFQGLEKRSKRLLL
ncbi:type II toxin-antitoxin system HipA family toxin [Thorsellia anophelis]|uniref:Serine/threonine-protein kinase HipA n=1 Tax=Thorsellia anophelis DSM 18579 TaxID=1123402 RepID=A0A1I0AVQ6_9GAMM|nr:type II toxin-antitoxin system HipA family toxin [Thorsellia anophelis]SES97650.1 serine/threonine-protein kinase HipA [Thorsellia anophelis DSM 18579]